MTHTLEVTEVDDNLLELLDQRASQQAQDRSAYVRDLLRRDLTAMQSGPALGKRTFAQILAPVHESVQQSGMTEAEVDALLTETLADVRRERRMRRSAEQGENK